VRALSPLALSHEFGEGGGVQLAFGDNAPTPQAVSSLDPLVVLAPTDCRLPKTAIGVDYGARCFGDLFVEVSGDRPFVKAVLDGLRFEES
jgi:hypothetical protein